MVKSRSSHGLRNREASREKKNFPVAVGAGASAFVPSLFRRQVLLWGKGNLHSLDVCVLILKYQPQCGGVSLLQCCSVAYLCFSTWE